MCFPLPMATYSGHCGHGACRVPACLTCGSWLPRSWMYLSAEKTQMVTGDCPCGKKIKGPVMGICFIAILLVGCWIGCYIDQPTNGNRTSMNGSMNGSECVAGLQSSKIHKTEFQACFENAIVFRSWGQWPSTDNSWNRLQVSCQW